MRPGAGRTVGAFVLVPTNRLEYIFVKARVVWRVDYYPTPTAETNEMDGILIIVSRDRPNLFQQLLERHGDNAPVILDRRKTPRPPTRDSGLWHTNLERDGYMVVQTT